MVPKSPLPRTSPLPTIPSTRASTPSTSTRSAHNESNDVVTPSIPRKLSFCNDADNNGDKENTTNRKVSFASDGVGTSGQETLPDNALNLHTLSKSLRAIDLTGDSSKPCHVPHLYTAHHKKDEPPCRYKQVNARNKDGIKLNLHVPTGFDVEILSIKNRENKEFMEYALLIPARQQLVNKTMNMKKFTRLKLAEEQLEKLRDRMEDTRFQIGVLYLDG
jgi:hypothetical protein